MMDESWAHLPHAVRALLALRLAAADLTWLQQDLAIRPFHGHIFMADTLRDVVRAQGILAECLSVDETAAYNEWRATHNPVLESR